MGGPDATEMGDATESPVDFSMLSSDCAGDTVFMLS